MTIEDPRLTAYALGEMEDGERALFERELEGDEAAKAEVEAIRAFAADVEASLVETNGVELDDARREALMQAATARRRRWPIWTAAAAVVLVMVGGTVYFMGQAADVSMDEGPMIGLMSAEPSPVGTARDTGIHDNEAVDPATFKLFSEFYSRINPPGTWGDAATEGQRISFHKPAEPEELVRLTIGSEPGIGDLFRRSPGVIAGVPARLAGATHGGESYEPLVIGTWLEAARHHTSTFSVDVDTASYSNVRRFLTRSSLPPPGAVRLEELVNYFDYTYAPPKEGAGAPFRTHVQVAQCPWTPKHRLARIGLKGRVIKPVKRPAANLVFLVDVSGSMADEDKLPLVKTGLEMLTENLAAEDRVGIVTYAGQAGVALETTPGSEKETILSAVRELRSGGSTNGEAGIQVAYEMATKAKQEGGVNRVILCTDGDFNVGLSDTGGLVQMIEKKARSGVYLSVLGFGTGNYKDEKMEALSNKGNGNYAYIDGQKEARRVLIEQMTGTLVTIAKDVKVQVFFNPQRVQGYRLLGYENRRLAARDFNDDKKDAGEIGAGHACTALYEIVPNGLSLPGGVDPNPFVEAGTPKKEPESPADAKALFRLRLRWKLPEGKTSALLEQDVVDEGLDFGQADRDFQWAASVAGYGMLLRHSPHAGQASWELVSELAQGAKGEDPEGRRAEFIELVGKAKSLSHR